MIERPAIHAGFFDNIDPDLDAIAMHSYFSIQFYKTLEYYGSFSRK